jgi:hypothetical protein
MRATVEKPSVKIRVDFQRAPIVGKVHVDSGSVPVRETTPAAVKVIIPFVLAGNGALLGNFRVPKGSPDRQVVSTCPKPRFHDMADPLLPAFVAEKGSERPGFLRLKPGG